MLKYLMITACSLSLISCAAQVPKEIDIPISVKQPAPRIPNRPILPIAKLTKGSQPNTVMKAYVDSVGLLIDDDNNLRAILKAYN